MDTMPPPSLEQSGHGSHVAGITNIGRKWTVGNDDHVWIPDMKILQISTPAPAERESIVQYQGLAIEKKCLNRDYCLNDYQANIPNWKTNGYLRDVVVATTGQAGECRAVKLVPELNTWIRLRA